MWQVARMGEITGVCGLMVRNFAGKRPLGSGRREQEDNLKMDLQELRWRHE